MKKIVFYMLITVIAPMMAFAEGRCFAIPQTPPRQAPFCYLGSEENCNAVGCEWRFKRYRCQRGPNTPPYTAGAIALPENCEALGCEWGAYYSP